MGFPVASLEHHNAKLEILRINDFLEEEVILIGGLAVQRYVLGRDSKDIDIVCSLDQQKSLIQKAYPSDTYEITEKQNDLRPNIVIRNLKSGAKTFLGTKIVERPPYPYIDYSTFREDSVDFEYDGKMCTMVRVPPAYILAFSKLISFIHRRNSDKGPKDLDDFANLTNHATFSLNRFIAYAEKLKANEVIRSFFEKETLNQAESDILRRCSPVRFQGIIPIALDSSSASRIGSGRDVEQLAMSLNLLSNSPVASELGRFFAAVNELQFSSDVIRRRWDIQIRYDMSRVSDGIITEIMEWEYELLNVRSHPVVHEIKLIHSSESEAGKVKRVYTVLPDGRRQEVEFTETTSYEGHHFKREHSLLTIDPGTPYFVTLYYENTWYVNPKRPFILNATTTKEPCLSCRIKFVVPDGFQVSILNRDIIEPHVIGNVHDVRLPKPLLAEQKIEYVFEEKR